MAELTLLDCEETVRKYKNAEALAVITTGCSCGRCVQAAYRRLYEDGPPLKAIESTVVAESTGRPAPTHFRRWTTIKVTIEVLPDGG